MKQEHKLLVEDSSEFSKYYYSSASVLDTEFFAIDEIVKAIVFLLFDAAKCMDHAILGFYFKIERTGASATSSKVYTSNFLKPVQANVVST